MNDYDFSLKGIKYEISYHIASYLLAIQKQIQTFNRIKKDINKKFKKSEVIDDIYNNTIFGIKTPQYKSKWDMLLSTYSESGIVSIDTIVDKDMSEIVESIPENLILKVLSEVYNKYNTQQLLPIITSVKDIINIPTLLYQYQLNNNDNFSQEYLKLLDTIYTETINNFMSLLNSSIEMLDNESYNSTEELIPTVFTFPSELFSKYKDLINNSEKVVTAFMIYFDKNENIYSIEYFNKDSTMKRVESRDIGYIRRIHNEFIARLTNFIYENFDELVEYIERADISYIYNFILEKLSIDKLKDSYFDFIEPISVIIVPSVILEQDSLVLISENNKSYPNYTDMLEQLSIHNNFISEGLYSLIYKPSLEYDRIIATYSSKPQEHNTLITYTYEEIKNLIGNLRYNTLSIFNEDTDPSTQYLKTIGHKLVSSDKSVRHTFSPNFIIDIEGKQVYFEPIMKDIIIEPSKQLYVYRSDLLDKILQFINVSEESNQITLDKYWEKHKDDILIDYLEQRISSVNSILKNIIEPMLVNYKGTALKYILDNLFDNTEKFEKYNIQSSVINKSSINISSKYLSDILNLIILNVKIYARYNLQNKLDIFTTNISNVNNITFEDLFGYDFKIFNKPVVTLNPTNPTGRELIKLLILLTNKKFILDVKNKSKEDIDMIRPENKTLSDIFDLNVSSEVNWGALNLTDEFIDNYKKYIYKLLNYVPLELKDKVQRINLDKFCFNYAESLLETNWYNLNPEDVLFNNKNINNELQDNVNIEYIINNIDDLINEVDISNTPIVVSESFVLVGALRDIHLLGEIFNPLTLKIAKKNPDKLYNKVKSYILANCSNNSLNLLSKSFKIMTEDNLNYYKEIINNNICLGKFTHISDILLCMNLSITNTLNYIKGTKIPVLQQVIINVDDETKDLVQEYYNIKFKLQLLLCLSCYDITANINELEERLIQIEDILYSKQLAPVVKNNRDLEFKKALLQNLPIEQIDTSNVSFEALTDPSYNVGNNPYSTYSLLTELYLLYADNGYDINEFISLLKDITYETISDLDLQIFRSIVESDTVCSKYNLFTLMSYLYDVDTFNDMVDIRDASYIISYLDNKLDEIGGNTKNNLRELISEIINTPSDFIYFNMINFVNSKPETEYNFSEFTLNEKPPTILLEYQNNLVNNLLQLI